MVYISDMETHELVYMNAHLRENLGYRNDESYKGKKCYSILQNTESVCSFCNNQELKQGTFITWIHENPVLKQKIVVKDSMIISKGRKYRIEIAVQAEKKGIRLDSHFYPRSEAVMNECLQYFFASQNPDESLDMLLSYLGKTFHCDRTYIFEFCHNQTINNTYEWCKEKVSPQKDILQNLPPSDIGYWFPLFEQNQSVIIKNLEDIRTIYPSTYSLLQPQDITSLIACPIYGDDILKGFIGMDNPDYETIPLLEQVVKSLSSSIAAQLKRRNLYKRFHAMSYQDPLTGAYNRNAMIEHNMRCHKWNSFGVVYCDINGLKQTNDTYGHDAGNKLIQKCYNILETSLSTDRIYRIGGDEFVATYYDVDKDIIQKDVDALKVATIQSFCQISVGYAWSNQTPIDMDNIINQADTMMYAEKEKYYANKNEKKKYDSTFSLPDITDFQMKLKYFLSNTYYDVSFLLEMLGNDNGTSYFFFGDMQKNLYFISDNMKTKFGFENNIVPDLIHTWASRIRDQNLLNEFWKDINDLLEQKKTEHDLRYPITDKDGNTIWIRCFGKIQWSKDRKKPLFFAGRITHQDESFIVDALTNFPTESVLIQYLKNMKEQGNRCQVVGFSFNHIRQINNQHGRRCGDDLICAISETLYQKLSEQVTFYRLNGMRCLALLDVTSLERIKELILQMKSIIEYQYQCMGLLIQHPCSFAILSYPSENASPQDFIENVISLIKVAQHEPSQLYVDNAKGNLQQLQRLSNMEMRLIEDIIRGMENFRIVIQPIVSTDTGCPIGGEVLLRWSFEGETISPAVFISIIERENMMHLVGHWVFTQAVHACIRVLSYCPDFYLAVNVSLQQLQDQGFADFIQHTLTKYHLDGKHIMIEMTESCMDEQPEALKCFVDACSNMGIRIALDDFGNGYSSLRVLLQYPSCLIKLDRTLLLEMSDSVEKSNFITSIVYACHQFGKQVCIEGVENEFQNTLVKEAGCDMIQGFYYYKPMEVDAIYQLLSQALVSKK